MSDMSVLSALMQRAGALEQQNENSTRRATVNLVIDTRGIGDIQVGPLDFGTAFVARPFFTSGVVVNRMFIEKATPDPDLPIGTALYDQLYRYPVVTAGVLRWQTVQSESGLELYTGATIYVSVQAEPLQPQRTDGRNLAQLRLQEAELATAQTQSVELLTARQRLREAIAARTLVANRPTVHAGHHLSFTAEAIKAAGLEQHPQLSGSLAPGTTT